MTTSYVLANILRGYSDSWDNQMGKSMRNKKRILLIIGVILFFGAAVAFGISRWYYWRGGAVMDGPGEFYSRMFRMYDLYLRISIGLLVAGAVSIALDFLLKIVRRS